MGPGSPSAPPTNPSATPLRKRLWPIVKWSLFLAVLWFVGRRGLSLWRDSGARLSDVDWRPGWLLLAGLLYLVSWLPSAWFWWKLLKQVGQHPPFPAATRAYYCGHLGKYIPGKATVLVLRGAMLRSCGVPFKLAGLTAAYETLIFMASGAAIAVALSPLIFRNLSRERWPHWLVWTIDYPLLPPLLVALLCLAALPIIARIFSWLAGVFSPAASGPEEAPMAARINSRVIAEGMFAFVISWSLQGVCLGCVLAGVGVLPFNWSLWPVWTGSTAAATVSGFAAIFAPGGVGVREWILGETLRLQPSIGPAHALSAAVMLRLVSFIIELAAGGLFGVTLLRNGMPTPPKEPPD